MTWSQPALQESLQHVLPPDIQGKLELPPETLKQVLWDMADNNAAQQLPPPPQWPVVQQSQQAAASPPASASAAAPQAAAPAANPDSAAVAQATVAAAAQSAAMHSGTIGAPAAAAAAAATAVAPALDALSTAASAALLIPGIAQCNTATLEEQLFSGHTPSTLVQWEGPVSPPTMASLHPPFLHTVLETSTQQQQQQQPMAPCLHQCKPAQQQMEQGLSMAIGTPTQHLHPQLHVLQASHNTAISHGPSQGSGELPQASNRSSGRIMPGL